MPPMDRTQRQQALMKELLNVCLGDKQKAIRLIEYERKQDPGLKTLEATERALDRLCYDRGKTKRTAFYDPKLFRRPRQPDVGPTPFAAAEQSPPNLSAGMVIAVVLVCLVAAGYFIKTSKPAALMSQSWLPAATSSPQAALPVQGVNSPGDVHSARPSGNAYPQGASTSGEIFKCSVKGKTVYSDQRCGPAAERLEMATTSGFTPTAVAPPMPRTDQHVAQRIVNEAAYERSIQTQQVATVDQTRKMECEALAKHISWLDSMSRQPQSGESQDRIKADKARAQSREMELRC